MNIDLSFFNNAFDALNNMIIPVVGFIITWSEVRDARKEKRIRDFSKAVEILPEDRSDYARQALEIYRKQYAKELADGTMVVRDLVYPTHWVQPAQSNDFMRLNDLPVDISQTKWTQPPPKSSYLPYMREGFASNKKTFSSGALLFNGPLFALERTRGSVADHSFAVTVKTAGYFDFLDTCEYLGYEMSYIHKIRRKRMPYRLGWLRGMPQRTRQRELRDLENRFAGIGVNCGTVLYNVEVSDYRGNVHRENFLLFHHRSGKVAECFGAMSAIPAGSYQPVGMELRSPFNRDMANTVYREFGEELLGIDEFGHLGDELMLEEKYRQWDVLLLGFGFEPLNTKIEVMTAMKIDMAQESNRELFNGQYSLEGLKQFFRTNYEGNLLMVPFSEPSLRQYHQDSRTTPVGKEILAILLDHFDYFAKP